MIGASRHHSPHSEATKSKLSEIGKKKFLDPNYKKRMEKMWQENSEKTRLRWADAEYKNRVKNSFKKKWKDKEWKEKQLEKMFKGMENRPTSLEKEMIDLIKRNNLPYKYTGDGDFWIGKKNPDFVNINGEKKLIEIGCKYYKKRSDGSVESYIKNRSGHFAKYGWKSYIFIGDILDEKKILNSLYEQIL